MKSTGIVRQLDSLGRVVIPIDLRRGLNITDKDSIEIFIEGDLIILKAFTPGCSFCGSDEKLTIQKKINICKSCRDEIKTMEIGI